MKNKKIVLPIALSIPMLSLICYEITNSIKADESASSQEYTTSSGVNYIIKESSSSQYFENTDERICRIENYIPLNKCGTISENKKAVLKEYINKKLQEQGISKTFNSDDLLLKVEYSIYKSKTTNQLYGLICNDINLYYCVDLENSIYGASWYEYQSPNYNNESIWSPQPWIYPDEHYGLISLPHDFREYLETVEFPSTIDYVNRLEELEDIIIPGSTGTSQIIRNIKTIPVLGIGDNSSNGSMLYLDRLTNLKTITLPESAELFIGSSSPLFHDDYSLEEIIFPENFIWPATSILFGNGPILNQKALDKFNKAASGYGELFFNSERIPDAITGHQMLNFITEGNKAFYYRSLSESYFNTIDLSNCNANLKGYYFLNNTKAKEIIEPQKITYDKSLYESISTWSNPQLQQLWCQMKDIYYSTEPYLKKYKQSKDSMFLKVLDDIPEIESFETYAKYINYNYNNSDTYSYYSFNVPNLQRVIFHNDIKAINYTTTTNESEFEDNLSNDSLFKLDYPLFYSSKIELEENNPIYSNIDFEEKVSQSNIVYGDYHQPNSTSHIYKLTASNGNVFYCKFVSLKDDSGNEQIPYSPEELIYYYELSLKDEDYKSYADLKDKEIFIKKIDNGVVVKNDDYIRIFLYNNNLKLEIPEGSNLEKYCEKWNYMTQTVKAQSSLDISSAYNYEDAIIKNNESLFTVVLDTEETKTKYQFGSDIVQIKNNLTDDNGSIVPSKNLKFTLTDINNNPIDFNGTSLSKLKKYLNNCIPLQGGVYKIICEAKNNEDCEAQEITISFSNCEALPFKINSEGKTILYQTNNGLNDYINISSIKDLEDININKIKVFNDDNKIVNIKLNIEDNKLSFLSEEKIDTSSLNIYYENNYIGKIDLIASDIKLLSNEFNINDNVGTVIFSSNTDIKNISLKNINYVDSSIEDNKIKITINDKNSFINEYGDSIDCTLILNDEEYPIAINIENDKILSFLNDKNISESNNPINIYKGSLILTNEQNQKLINFAENTNLPIELSYGYLYYIYSQSTNSGIEIDINNYITKYTNNISKWISHPEYKKLTEEADKQEWLINHLVSSNYNKTSNKTYKILYLSKYFE